MKCKDYVELLANGSGDILFFRDRDGPPVPTLRILHQYPFLLKPQQVDKGAIRFILSGANIMCPGLTSPGANMIDAAESEIVAIYAEGQGVKLRCKKVRCWYRTRTKARLPPRNATTRVNRVERGKGKSDHNRATSVHFREISNTNANFPSQAKVTLWLSER